MTAYQARNQAEELVQEMGITSAPVDVEGIAQKLGLRVLYEDLGEDVSGVLITSTSGANVVVQAADHTNRQRFTIAHEIGHYRLKHQFDGEHVHVDHGNFISRRDSTSSTGVDPKEIEANQFAASLLMPPDLLKKEVEALSVPQLLDNHVAHLAKQFKVSEHAMTIRLTRLGLL